MMVRERIIGACAIAFGACLLLFVLPAQVRYMPGTPTDPSVLPRFVGWAFIVLGIVHLLVTKVAVGPGLTPRGLTRFLTLLAVLLAAAFLYERIGHIPTMAGVAIAALAMMKETRLYWAVPAVILFPVGSWALFELLLLRALP